MIPLGIVALLVALGGIGAATSSPGKQDAAKVEPIAVTTESQTASSKVGVPASSSPRSTTTKPRSSAPATTTAAPATSRAAVPQTPTDDGSFTMPNEVGKVLQDAQDDVQNLSRDPVFVTHSHDLLSSRYQVLDRDWKVCGQNVAPGSKASAVEHIDFGVVKLSEACP